MPILYGFYKSCRHQEKKKRCDTTAEARFVKSSGSNNNNRKEPRFRKKNRIHQVDVQNHVMPLAQLVIA